MGEQAAAAGLAALTFDCRGHGAERRRPRPARLARRRGRRRGAAARPAARRGSRRAGPAWAAASCCWPRAPGPASSARSSLLCPADGASLLRGLDRLGRAEAAGRHDGRARFDASRLRPFLARPRPDRGRARPAAGAARPRARRRRRALRAQRAAGGRARCRPRAFIVLEDGGHHGPGRSPEVARATLDWALGTGRDGGGEPRRPSGGRAGSRRARHRRRRMRTHGLGADLETVGEPRDVGALLHDRLAHEVLRHQQLGGEQSRPRAPRRRMRLVRRRRRARDARARDAARSDRSRGRS